MSDEMQNETTHDHAHEQGEKVPALTAFVVYIDDRGQAQALMNHQDIEKFQVMHAPTLQDVYRACSEVAKDVQAVEIAQRCVEEQVRVSQQIAEQQQAEKIRQDLQT